MLVIRVSVMIVYWQDDKLHLFRFDEDDLLNMDFGNYLASSSDEEGVWSAEGATNDTSDKYRVIFITKLQSSYS